MPSNIWTIVWLTLTLLICGCADSEVAKVNTPGTTGVAAASPISTVADSNCAPLLPPDAGINESHEFQVFPLEVQERMSRQRFPSLPGAHVLESAPVAFPSPQNGGIPTAPAGRFGFERIGEHPGLPLELPGLEGAPKSGLPRLSGSAASPNLPSENGEPQFSILEQE